MAGQRCRYTFKVLTEPVRRKKSWAVDIITKDEPNIYELFTSFDEQKDKLKVDECLVVTYCNSVNGDHGNIMLRLSKNSKVYRAGSFTPCERILNEYFHPAVLPVNDALMVSPKKRISIKGMVEEVSPVKCTDSTKRKEVVLYDSTDRRKMLRLNMWGDMADKDVPAHNTIVCVKNIATDVFQGKISFNSTPHTCIEVPTEKKMTDINVLGFSEEDNNMLALLTAEENDYIVNREVLLSAMDVDSVDDLVLPQTITVNYTEATREISGVDKIIGLEEAEGEEEEEEVL